MTRQLRVAGALAAAAGAFLVLGVPLMILLVLDPSAQAACGGTPTGPGPSSVPGIPPNLLPIFEGAAQQFELGNDGWAYLAALNDAESSFGTDNGPGTGVLSGSNSAGAAGPMQIGIGGAATDNWDTIVAEIPTGLPGGTQPPSVYNEVDAVYGAAALLKKWGAPQNWQAALVAGTTTRPRSRRSPSSSRSTPKPARGTAARPRPRRRPRPYRQEARDVSRSAGRRPPARSPRSCPTGWRRSRRARRPRCRR